MHSLNRRALKHLLAATVVAMGTTSAAAQSVKLDFPFEVPAEHIKGKTIQKFADVLEESTDGYYDVVLHPAGQLMAPTEEIAAAARGQVQMAAPFLNYVAGVESGFNLYNMPMLFGSYEDLAAVTDGEVGEALLERLEERGLVGLGYWFEAPIHLFANKPVRTLEDMEGLKIRVFPSDALISTTELLDASPTAIPGPEIYLALQQGVADGAWTTPTYAVTINMADVQEAMTKVALSYGGYAVMINRSFWQEQPADKQQAIRDAVAEATRYNRENLLVDLGATDAALTEAGMEIVELDDDERSRWVEAIRPYYETLDNDLRSLADEAREAMPE